MKERGPEGFEAFWSVYPKRVARVAALKAWRRVVAEDEIGDVLDGVNRWKNSNQWEDIQYVPYPATFLNQRRWEDEVPQRQSGRQAYGTNATDAVAKTLKNFGLTN